MGKVTSPVCDQVGLGTIPSSNHHAGLWLNRFPTENTATVQNETCKRADVEGIALKLFLTF